MKKKLCVLLLGLCLFSVSACGDKTASTSSIDSASKQEEEAEEAGNNSSAKDNIKIEDISWNVDEGIVDGERYILLSYINNTKYTIAGFEIQFTEKSDITEEEKTAFYTDIQEKYEISPDEMESLKGKPISMYAEAEIVVNPGESVTNTRCWYYRGYHALRDLSHFQLVQPDIATIRYVDNDKIYTVYYDYSSGKYSAESETEWPLRQAREDSSFFSGEIYKPYRLPIGQTRYKFSEYHDKVSGTVLPAVPAKLPSLFHHLADICRQCIHKKFSSRPGNRQALSVDPAVAFQYRIHIFHIDQIPFINAEKSAGRQQVLCLLHISPAYEYLPLGMIVQRMALAFHVINFIDVHFSETAFERNGHKAGFPAFNPLNRFIQFLGKDKICHRLQNIVQSVHFISADCVLGHICYEKNNHLGILPPYFFRRRHPIHKLHLYIHQNNIKLGLVSAGNFISVPIDGKFKLFSHFLLVLLQILF